MNFVYERREPVRFGHCDPAGIVFYPRYFEMLNAVIEDWISQGLGIAYAELLGPRRVGLPTVSLNTEFKRISRMGDELVQRIAIQRLGRTSLTLRVEFSSDDGLRVGFDQVLVCTSLETHQAQEFPADLRAALERAQGVNE
ncbi:thioesterase family protein [Pelomonas sp. SE-A7]|uniref:acyl-CoA thioesterase n=1 Tax=Pelomonas sp. SE-A7 TaxID=3054953 RepID=UPI00259CC512|nr:thioesterase family protein [Pelomonas sp. SE-A7]MDM4764635.1 thioesterase family protein [Pelomonas sp. SE-A7]